MSPEVFIFLALKSGGSRLDRGKKTGEGTSGARINKEMVPGQKNRKAKKAAPVSSCGSFYRRMTESGSLGPRSAFLEVLGLDTRMLHSKV